MTSNLENQGTATETNDEAIARQRKALEAAEIKLADAERTLRSGWTRGAAVSVRCWTEAVAAITRGLAKLTGVWPVARKPRTRKPDDQKCVRLQVTCPPDVAAKIRKRGGSRYLQRLVKADRQK